MEEVPEMDSNGDGAESISGCNDRRKAAIERKMQQYGGKQAQDGEAEKDDDFREFRISRGCNQGGDGADVPEEGETGGSERQPASTQPCTGAVPEEQIQKNTEDDGSAGVTD